MKKLWLIMGCMVVILAFAVGYATMQQTARKEKETLAADVPFVTAIRDEELNGAIGYEWIDANSQEIEIGRFDAVLLSKHDGENLYLGLEIATGERFDSLELYVAFDANRNGDFFDQGDDILIITLEKGDFVKSEDIDYFYPETYQFALDRGFGGTNNATGVVAVWGEGTEALYVAELKKSLVGDPDMDISLTPGDDLNFVIGVIGYASPDKEEVSPAIKAKLGKLIKEYGEVRVGDVSYKKKGKGKGQKIKIEIHRTKPQTNIKVDPDNFDPGSGPGAPRREDVNGVILVWDRDVDGDKAKEMVISTYRNVIDFVQDGEHKYSVALKPQQIVLVPAQPEKRGGVKAPEGTVPKRTKLTITIKDKQGKVIKKESVIASEDGSFRSKDIRDVKKNTTVTITMEVTMLVSGKKATTHKLIYPICRKDG